MNRTIALSFLLGIAFPLVACGCGPAAAGPAIEVGVGPVVDTEQASLLSTTVGNVRVTGVDSDPGFPPGCAQVDCEISVESPNALVIVWLEAEGGGPVPGDLTEECEENASLIGEDNQPNSCFSAGVLDSRIYVIFPVPAPSSRYILRWGDNPPVLIVP